jgi:transcription antitermination protein NusB
MVLSRNKAQEIAMTLIYNALTLMKVDEALDVEALITRYFDEPYEDIDVFVKEILIKMVKYQTVMTDHISSHLKNWTFDRLNLLTQAIFMLAYTHFHYVGDVDKKVVIDNAVKLAKKFVDEKDYKFVNAILDKVL